jgi:hypothetical protein
MYCLVLAGVSDKFFSQVVAQELLMVWVLNYNIYDCLSYWISNLKLNIFFFSLSVIRQQNINNLAYKLHKWLDKPQHDRWMGQETWQPTYKAYYTMSTPVFIPITSSKKDSKIKGQRSTNALG